jgi:RNA polymerase sigma factor for flagellar operon FliA
MVGASLGRPGKTDVQRSRKSENDEPLEASVRFHNSLSNLLVAVRQPLPVEGNTALALNGPAIAISPVSGKISTGWSRESEAGEALRTGKSKKGKVSKRANEEKNMAIRGAAAAARAKAITPATKTGTKRVAGPVSVRATAKTRLKLVRAKKSAAVAQASSPSEQTVSLSQAKPAVCEPALKKPPVRESRLEIRDRVVMEHLPLVKAIAIRVHDSLPVHVELDDLVHAGILGLFYAAVKYNPTKQVAFSSYAKHRIKGAILDSLRQLDWASRDLRRRHKQVEQITRELYMQFHRMPTEQELADKLGVDVEKWRQMAVDLQNVGLISASTRPQDQEDAPAPDFPSKPETQPDSMCARVQLKERLTEAMSVLPERYKKVVVLYYTNEMTMKEIGGILGINESRVSQIHKSALEKMASALQSAGITSASVF